MDIFLLWVLRVVRWKSLRRADHSPRGVLPSVVCRCVWPRNFKNDEVIAHIRPQRHRKKNILHMIIYSGKYIGRFIMFSVITNIYSKKTKGPTLMELFTATGKLKKVFFFTTRDFRCVHHGWHGTHRYDIQVLATHASTCLCLCGKNWNTISMCAVSPVVHTSKISSY